MRQDFPTIQEPPELSADRKPAWDTMNRLPLIIIGAVAVLLGGLFVVFATIDLPAPSQPVEKVIPNDRFPR
jgi:hypothetical protein